MRNKRCGPGGSTRQLHHLRAFDYLSGILSGGGAETGSTRAVKVFNGVRHCIRRYRAILIVANDNSQFVASNDNSVVEGEGRIAA